MALASDRFETRLNNLGVSHPWYDDLSEIADTAETMQLWMEDHDIDSPELLLGLTRLVVERHDAREAS